MKKVIIVVVFLMLIFYLSSTGVFAKPLLSVSTPSPTTDSAIINQVDTFTLFWPLTAGKTRADSIYILKQWKEELRALLIFGKPQKAEYMVFLSSKRLLEADSLIRSGKTDLAFRTLEDALINLNKAEKFINESKDDTTLNSVSEETKKKLKNLTILLDYLISQSKEPMKMLKEVKDKSVALDNIL